MIVDVAIFRLLLSDVKDKFARPLQVHRDFAALSESILDVTGSCVSTSSLKRYWKRTDINDVHTSTLDILALYVGYADFAAYERNERLNPTDTSYMMSSNNICARNLAVGQKLCLTWFPDRKVVVCHDEGTQFHVISSLNSKLEAGDCFDVDYLINRCPLILANVRRGDNELMDYICAQDNSLDITLID